MLFYFRHRAKFILIAMAKNLLDQKPRRRLIINREVQFDVLMYVWLFVFSLFVIQTLTAILFISQIEGAIEMMTAREFLANYKVSFWVYQFVPVSICCIVGFFVFSKLTSRIVGPVYNMQRVLKKNVDSDKVPQIRVREDDYFRQEMQDVNLLLKRKID